MENTQDSRTKIAPLPLKLNSYTPFGSPMRSLELLRLVGGKISGSRCVPRVLRPGGVWEDMFWNIDIFTCVLVGSEFP